MIIKFIKKVFAFSLIVILLLTIYVLSFNSGRIDFYYKRISSPKSPSLVFGVSRAAQGVVPSVLNSHLSEINPNFYNFSFAANYSPYGEVYFKSLKNKIRLPKGHEKSIYIVTVDPRSLSVPKDYLQNKDEGYDKNSFLNHIDCVDCMPNIDYILYGHETYYKKLFLNCIRGEGYLHDDGWLEIKIKNDSISRNNRLEKKLKNKEYEMNYKLSGYRTMYFSKTISYLSEIGEVYIVRMPVHKKILGRQNINTPGFDKKVDSISKIYNVEYFNFVKDEGYDFTDGSHLTNYSAKKFSKNLAELIRENIN